MRKILYSPGYGAGWTTWNSEPVELAKFLLEYQPIIDYLEAGGKFERGECDNIVTGEKDDKLHPLLRQLQVDAKETFGASIHVYFGGAPDLQVVEIPDGEKVLIEEYDGNESYRTRSDDDGWM
jgi:hypothetical protein